MISGSSMPSVGGVPCSAVVEVHLEGIGLETVSGRTVPTLRSRDPVWGERFVFGLEAESVPQVTCHVCSVCTTIIGTSASIYQEIMTD